MTTRYERRGDVAVLQLDNPPVNGLGHVTRRTLSEGLERALDDPAVKVIVITGAGKVFSGGADIREFNTPAALGRAHPAAADRRRSSGRQAGDRGDQRRVHGRRPRAGARLPLPRRARRTRRSRCPR